MARWISLLGLSDVMSTVWRVRGQTGLPDSANHRAIEDLSNVAPLVSTTGLSISDWLIGHKSSAGGTASSVEGSLSMVMGFISPVGGNASSRACNRYKF